MMEKNNSLTMKQSTKPPETKRAVGQPCSICARDNLNAINKGILDGKSFRSIAKQIIGDENSYQSVARHTNNCLNIDSGAIKSKNLLAQKEKFFARLDKQFTSIEKLIDATESWLSDPDNPDEFSIVPRADELNIIYLDYNDRNEAGKPRRKQAPLSDLLAALSNAQLETVKVVNTATDNRKLLIDGLSQFTKQMQIAARVYGIEQQPRENEQRLANTVRAVVDWLTDNPDERNRLDDVIRDFSRGRIVNADELRAKVLEQLESVH